MDSHNGGMKRLVLRIKPGSQLPRKKIPRKLFLGVRFKDSPAVLCPLPKMEEKK